MLSYPMGLEEAIDPLANVAVRTHHTASAIQGEAGKKKP
jgi:hypothetical protein